MPSENIEDINMQTNNVEMTETNFESENLNKRITARRGLYEEAKADSIPSVAESMMTLHQYHTADTQERKNNLPARQDRLNQAYEKIDMDRRVGKALAGIAAVGIMGQVGNQGHQM